MQKINLIAQSVLELSHREKVHDDDDDDNNNDNDNDDDGLNYSPRRNVFRRGQKVARL